MFTTLNPNLISEYALFAANIFFKNRPIFAITKRINYFFSLRNRLPLLWILHFPLLQFQSSSLQVSDYQGV